MQNNSYLIKLHQFGPSFSVWMSDFSFSRCRRSLTPFDSFDTQYQFGPSRKSLFFSVEFFYWSFLVCTILELEIILAVECAIDSHTEQWTHQHVQSVLFSNVVLAFVFGRDDGAFVWFLCVCMPKVHFPHDSIACVYVTVSAFEREPRLLLMP